MQQAKIAVICLCLLGFFFSTEVLPQGEKKDAETKDEKIERLLENLNKNIDEDQIDAAISNIEYLLLLAPSNKDFIELKSNLFYIRGGRFFEAGDYDKALQDFDVSIETNEKNADLFEARAKVYLFKEDFEKASADAKTAIRLEPKISHAYAVLSGSYFSKEEFAKSIDAANLALKRDKNDLLALEYRGASYASLEKNNLALKDLNRVLKNQPENLNALIHRMFSYSGLENWKATRDDANAILKMQDDFAPAYALRASANMVLKGNLKLVISDFNMTEQLNPELMTSDNYELRAIAYRQIGMIAEAERDEKKSKEMRLKEKEGNEQ